MISLGFPIVPDGGSLGLPARTSPLMFCRAFSIRSRQSSQHDHRCGTRRRHHRLSGPSQQIQTVDGRPAVARVADIADDDLREAYRRRAELSRDDSSVFARHRAARN